MSIESCLLGCRSSAVLEHTHGIHTSRLPSHLPTVIAMSPPHWRQVDEAEAPVPPWQQSSQPWLKMASVSVAHAAATTCRSSTSGGPLRSSPPHAPASAPSPPSGAPQVGVAPAPPGDKTAQSYSSLYRQRAATRRTPDRVDDPEREGAAPPAHAASQRPQTAGPTLNLASAGDGVPADPLGSAVDVFTRLNNAKGTGQYYSGIQRTMRELTPTRERRSSDPLSAASADAGVGATVPTAAVAVVPLELRAASSMPRLPGRGEVAGSVPAV